MSFGSLQEALQKALKEKKRLWEIFLEEDQSDRQVTREDSLQRMQKQYEAMVDAHKQYDEKVVSASGLSGTQAAKMQRFAQKNASICGLFVTKVITYALQMAESNACMKRIVAAPTAGACGVVPAILLTFAQCEGCTEEELIRALYLAGGIGIVIAKRACISGAEGGCQAEIGSASAMAAAAAVFLKGGTDEQALHASAMALKNLLGLVCDPVAGLVEVPCVKRNVGGAVNALAAADMALAGIESKIPIDEVIDAMAEVGHAIPKTLRETAEGGLAVTKTAQKIQENFMKIE